MFEDSTFESAGRIRTRSRGWMIAALAFNSSILFALILIPLIYPEALPSQATAFLRVLEAPLPPAEQPPPRVAAQPFQGARQFEGGHIFAPSRIPIGIRLFAGPEQAPVSDLIAMGQGPAMPNGDNSLFHSQAAARVHPAAQGPVRVAGTVEAGLILQKTIPRYPPLALAMHQEGTVVLAASISCNGAIENLRVVSGPGLLQQAAIDAVSTWRYRPYLLDGQPVEIETTVNVIFTLAH